MIASKQKSLAAKHGSNASPEPVEVIHESLLQKNKSSLQRKGPFLKAIAWTLFFVTLFFCLSLVVVAGYAYSYLSQLAQAAQTTPSELVTTVWSEWQKAQAWPSKRVTWLVLGLDSIESRTGESGQLTDSIILVSFHPANDSVHLLSLPRDLWIEEYQTKVNALYFYGAQRQPEDPTAFPKEVIQDLVGTPIDRVVVITPQYLEELIVLSEGVTIDVPEAFVDEQYPSDDATQKYTTIQFEKGVQRLSADKALQYIRSRKSLSSSGSDDSRTQRQQQVIKALIAEFSSRSFFQDPQKVGKLWLWYQQRLAGQVPLDQVFGALKTVTSEREWPYTFELHSHFLTVAPQNDSSQGQIWHPPLQLTQNQWAYLPIDRTVLAEYSKRILAIEE